MQTVIETSAVTRNTILNYTDANATTGETIAEDKTTCQVVQKHTFDAGDKRNYKSTVVVINDHKNGTSETSIQNNPSTMTEAEAEEFALLPPILNTLVDTLKLKNAAV